MARYLVQYEPGRKDALLGDLRLLKVAVVSQPFDYLVVDIPEEMVARVRAASGVVAMTPDRPRGMAQVLIPVDKKLLEFRRLFTSNPFTGPALAFKFIYEADAGKQRVPTSVSRKMVGGDVADKEQITGKGVKVAVLDTGTDYGGIQGPYLGGRSSVEGSPIPIDENGHGTHVATTISGRPFQSIHGLLKGVAVDSEVAAFKVLGYLIGAGCLVGSTWILTVSGFKKIHRIQIGDALINYNLAAGAFEADRVVRVLRRRVSPEEGLFAITVDEGHIVYATEEHPFLTESGWVESRHLKVGDHLLAYPTEERFRRARGSSWNAGVPWGSETKMKIRQSLKARFPNGRIPWNKGKKGWTAHSPETKEKAARGLEGGRGWNVGRKGWATKSEEARHRSEIGLAHGRYKGKTCSVESRRRGAQTLREGYASGRLKPFWLGKPHSDDTRRKISEGVKRAYKEGRLMSPFALKPMSAEVRAKALSKALEKRTPNKKEEVLSSLLARVAPGEFAFVGNGQVKLGYFNPDFINVNGKKQVVELFGCHWHHCPTCFPARDKRKSRGEINNRVKNYTRFGFTSFIVWEHELKEPEKLEANLRGFMAAPVDPVIVSISKCARRPYVYDLETERNHTLIANGLVVHNSTSSILRGIADAVEWGADIVSMSLGGEEQGPDDPENRIITALTKQGMVFCIAAGNSGDAAQTVGTPGDGPDSLTVGAVDIEGKIAPFSSRGTTKDGRIKPDLCAPGVNILSSTTGLIALMQFMDGFKLGAISGTSMATPHVSGTVALALQYARSKGKQLTTDGIKEAMSLYGEYPGSGKRNDYGWGLIHYSLLKRYIDERL